MVGWRMQKMKKRLKKWRKGKELERTIGEKKKYREMYERKRREKNERWMEETKTQKQVWEVVNRERKKKVEVNRGIEE